MAARSHWKHREFTLAKLKPFRLSAKLENIRIDTSHNILVHVPDMFLSSHFYVTHCILKFKLLYFQNKAHDRAENVQADIFLKYLLPDKEKN